MTPTPTPRTHPYISIRRFRRGAVLGGVLFLAGLGFYGSIPDAASLVLLFLAPITLWEVLRWGGL